MSAKLQKQPQKASVTPMMRQYLQIKEQNQDAIVFFRLGDFYEMFFEDAHVASRLLDLTLTQKNKNTDNPIPMCGIPHHASESYIAKLIKQGKKVVICDQTEDASKAKGLVKREVTRVVSPGIVLEEQSLAARQHNYLLAVCQNKTQFSCALCDVSTGLLEYFVTESSSDLLDEVARLDVKELIFPESLRGHGFLKDLSSQFPHLYQHAVTDLWGDSDFACDLLKEQFQVSSLASLGLDESGCVSVLGSLLGYLKDSQILKNALLSQPQKRNLNDFVVLDENTVRNLELFKTLRDDKNYGTLLWHLDVCQTPMGSRKLADFVRHPLMDVQSIEERFNAVAELLERQEETLNFEKAPSIPSGLLFEQIQQALDGVYDLERLANRFVTAKGSARDAVSLKNSLKQIPILKTLLSNVQSGLLKALEADFLDFKELIQSVQECLVDEPPLSLKDGHMIRPGFHKELDELRHLEKNGKNIIANLEAKEREATGVSSLKVRFNNVFGYYIEITNTHKDKVPAHYIRKQTLTNAERYITEELKQYEEKVLSAGERIKTLEYDLFASLRETIQNQATQIKTVAQNIAVLDVLCGFAQTAQVYDYKRPKVNSSTELVLKGARHPILERMNPGESFVPNDVCLNGESASFMMITGPNMAGKSTIMRMTALIALMAQMGSFVPCEEARVGVCDRIFTRVGAHDHLQKGLSTFMVEMVETAKIIREATPKSLILLDEIGRGTSTFDGLSIAWAVSEDIHDRLQARTLFATHYHELCDLSEQKSGVVNFHMSVKEWNGQVIFLRKLKPGSTNRSYGVTVAGMAGLPEVVIDRAHDILDLLEKKDLGFKEQVRAQQDSMPQMNLFESEASEVEKALQKLNIHHITPIEALNILNDLKKQVS